MSSNRFMNRKWFKGRKKNPSQTPVYNPSLHGYYGFKLYFTNAESIDVPKTLADVSTFEKYIQRNDKQYSLPEIRKNKVFFADLNQLESDEEFQTNWSEFKTEIVTKTEYCLSCMGLAMHQTLLLQEKPPEAQESDSKEVPHIPFINARITNHQPILNLKALKVNYFGTLVSVRGTVIKASKM